MYKYAFKTHQIMLKKKTFNFRNIPLYLEPEVFNDVLLFF